MSPNEELAVTIAELQKALDDSMAEMYELSARAENAPSEYVKEEITWEMRELEKRMAESAAIIEKVLDDVTVETEAIRLAKEYRNR